VSDITVAVAASAPSVAVTEQVVLANTPAPQMVAVSVAGALPAPVSVSQSSVFQAVVSPAVPPSGGAPETYETISKNLRSYPATLSHTAGELASISYATPSGAVVKTFNRIAGRLASIVLSGALPSGIATTKTLTYTNDTLTGVAYG